MLLRETLAANLRQLCRGEESIAAVCRATQINRQQFNRYLSGDSLPSQRTRNRICSYFGITEPDLFREDRSPGPPRQPFDDMPGWSHTEVRSALKLLMSESATSVPPGLYFVHFLVPQQKNTLMRSTMVIRRDGNMTTFRRLTGLSERRGSWWGHFSGDHRGLVLERRHLLYFVALNARHAREPTFMTLRWQPVSRPILGGNAMILTPAGPTIAPVVVAPCRKGTTIRAAMRASHVYSLDDAQIDPIVADLLEQQRQSLLTTMQHYGTGIPMLA